MGNIPSDGNVFTKHKVIAKEKKFFKTEFFPFGFSNIGR